MKYLTVIQAAAKMQVSQQYIRQLIQEKRIECIRFGKAYAIPTNFKIKPSPHGRRGRPRKALTIL